MDSVHWEFRKGKGETALPCSTVSRASAEPVHYTGSYLNSWWLEQLGLENSFLRWLPDSHVWSLSWDHERADPA